MTSISDTGNMHSDFAEPAHETHELPALEPAEPTSPIAHESAVVALSSEAPAHFEPGTGFLEEEEFLDDEDEQAPVALHAVAAPEEDHETLEGAADLGTMLREMSIDQITRTEPAQNEDDEEDFLEEDQDYEESGAESGVEGLEGEEPEDHEEHAEGERFEEGTESEGERPTPCRHWRSA